MHHPPVSRRGFIGIAGGAFAGAVVGLPRALFPSATVFPEGLAWDPKLPFRVVGRPLRVQPILMYSTPTPKPETSWKSWGGVQTEEAAEQETRRISEELRALAATVDFPLEPLTVRKVKAVEEVDEIHAGDHDSVIVYPATGSGSLLKACLAGKGTPLIFVRHRSGPVYYWYEALSIQYLNPDPGVADLSEETRRASVEDVVVDDPGELAWRLRALYAVRNLLGEKVVALGGAWGKYAPKAPEIARERFGIEILDVSYEEIEPRLKSMLEDKELLARAEEWTERYLALPNTSLETKRGFVVNAFVLYVLFKELMKERECEAFTIKSCMGTIIPMSQTTACLTLSLLNDEGLLAFCESDFVVIPAGILLRHLTGRPVFLHNSTFPHQKMVTCAHCTSPRRLDGTTYEPVRVVTHYESDFGAAPKVEMPKGTVVTFIDPEYATGRWVGFRGTIESNPSYEICRSQQDVKVEGNWKKLLREVRDSHWLMVYGDCLDQAGYAARKLGLTWETLPEV